jgi:adenine-specific DNA-methyltransferase
MSVSEEVPSPATSDEAAKLDPATPDLAAANRAAFEELFPGVLIEGVLDAQRLAGMLDAPVTAPAEGRERFGLMWAGKQDALRSLLTPSRATLIPDLSNSVDFDTAQNVFIEGDNLEVLKILQKAYNDQVKLIYIDPPYNTGNDFIYNDDFSDGLRGYLRYTGQLDDDGNRLAAGIEVAGRRHSRWLSMMFTRLVLARNLLSHDGVIFVSIDDNEQHNLRSLMEEVFGPENFLGCICVVSNLKGRSDDKYFATAHNYLLVFQRSEFLPLGVPLPDQYLADYSERDEEGRAYRLQGLRKRGSSSKRTDRPAMYYPFYIDASSGAVSLARTSSDAVEVLPVLSDGTDGRWRWGKSTAETRRDELIGRQVGPERRWDVFQIDWLVRDGEEKRVKPKTMWDGPEMANEAGSLQVKKIFGGRVFDNPKPMGLMRQILDYSVGPSDLVLDFFAGSGAMAHAVLEANAADGGNRRCISVNLPEPTPEGSVAREAGFDVVSAITLARIKAAMKDTPGSLKQGLRTLVLGQSSFRQAESGEGPIEQLDLQGRTLVESQFDPHAVALEILLREGVPLDAPWTWTQIGEAAVVEADSVAIVLTTEPTDGLVAEVIGAAPRVVVFLEDGFAGRDSVKANAFFSCKQAGITLKTV